MSVSRDLAKQFAQENKTPENIDKQTSAVSEMLGITADSMVNTIGADIAAMIEKALTRELEGYILCLSRIMKHNTAWECIVDAFKISGQKIPQRYYQLFGKDPNKLPKHKGMKAE